MPKDNIRLTLRKDVKRLLFIKKKQDNKSVSELVEHAVLKEYFPEKKRR